VKNISKKTGVTRMTIYTNNPSTILHVLKFYVLDGAQLHEWNLYAIAWRIVERSMDYPYQNGDVIVFGGRTAIIKSVKIEKRSAELMNGTLVPLSSIRMKEPLLEPEQLTLF
jgi:hypothetical protein